MKWFVSFVLVAGLLAGCGEEAQEEAKREWSRVEQEEEEAKRIAKSIGWHDYKIIAEAIEWVELSANFTWGDDHFGKHFAPNQQTPYTGWVKRMHNNGQIVWLTQFKDGGHVGPSTEWYNNGQKRSETTFKDGGPVTIVVWKPNGEKCPDTKLVDGNGVWVWYKDDGTEDYRWTYKDGVKVRD